MPHAGLLEYLSLDKKTVRKLMGRTPEHIDKPWVNYGTAKRPRYHWKADKIDRWFREVTTWQTSEKDAEGTRFAGEPQMERKSRSNAQTKRRQKRSKGRLSDAKPLDKSGSLLNLANQLTLRK